jgi:hypothetical protein
LAATKSAITDGSTGPPDLGGFVVAFMSAVIQRAGTKKLQEIARRRQRTDDSRRARAAKMVLGAKIPAGTGR